MGNLLLQNILIIFLVSIPVVIIFRKLRLPSIIGFIATGAIIGPQGLGFIQDKNQIDILAEVGITLLLFTVGLEFSFSSFAKMKKQGISSGVFQIILTATAGYIIGSILQWPPYQSLYFGCILALSSTAIVLTSYMNLHRLESVAGRMSTVILILQDLAIIPMMVLLPWMGRVSKGELPLHELTYSMGMAMLLVLGVALFTRYLASPLLRLVSKTKSRDLFVITVICIALGMAWVTHYLGLSFALGAFLGGIMVGATEYHYQALSDIKPFQFSFTGIFFVSIGMIINFSFLQKNFLMVILLVMLIPLLKVIITTTVVFLTRIPLRLALVVGFSLGQIGEFSYLLALLGYRTGVLGDHFYQLILSIAVVTMMLSPIFILHAPRLAEFIAGLPGFRYFSRSNEEERAHAQAAHMENHVIICGFGPLGETFGKILKEHHIPYLVLELNPDTITRLKNMDDRVFFGDGASEEILYKSNIDKARLLAITVPDFLNAAAIIKQALRLNPDIKIITRAKYRNEVEMLYKAGADIVISEELEGGIEMARYALRVLGLENEKVDPYLKKLRDFGSADFF